MAFTGSRSNETKSAPEDYAKAERIRREVAETREKGTITTKSATTGQYARKGAKDK